MTVTVLKKPILSQLIVDKVSVTLKIQHSDQHQIKENIMILIENYSAKRTFKGFYALSAYVSIDDNPDAFLLVQCEPKVDASYFRLEFNPNTCNMSDVQTHINFILPGGYQMLISQGKCTRVDITIDVNNININDLLLWHPGFKKSSGYYGNGRIETLYIGTADSPKSFCIYDKKLEIKRKNKKKYIKHEVPLHDITRIEARIRDDLKFHDLESISNPFKKFGVTKCVLPTSQHIAFPLFMECCRSRGTQDALLMIKNNDLRKKFRNRLNLAKVDWWNTDNIWAQWPHLIKSILYPGKPKYSLNALHELGIQNSDYGFN